MTALERRIVFLAGILQNAEETLNHAAGLCERESAKLIGFNDPDGTRLVCQAFYACEAAKEHFFRKMEDATKWDEEKEGGDHA